MAFEYLKIDRALANPGTVSLVLNDDTGPFAVVFQFPPIIKSDNKTVNYTEKNMFNIEPYALFSGSGARTIELNWTYIVTGGEWTIKRIAELVKKTRGYMYQTSNTNFTENRLVIFFYAYNIVGNNQRMTFRSDGLRVSHSDVIVRDSGMTYSLKTDLSMTLKLWTQGEVDKDSEEPLVYIPTLSKASDIRAAKPDWY